MNITWYSRAGGRYSRVVFANVPVVIVDALGSGDVGVTVLRSVWLKLTKVRGYSECDSKITI